MPIITFISFRLNGVDGVSIEAAKWEHTLRGFGFATSMVSGAVRPSTFYIPELTIHDDVWNEHAGRRLRAALSETSVVIVDNMFSLPFNPSAARGVAEILQGRRAIIRHHDLPWRREGEINRNWVMPDDPAWIHTTINQDNARQLEEKGIPAHVLYNTFAVPDTERVEELALLRPQVRAQLGVHNDDLLLVQPTRAIERKNIPGGLRIAEAVAEKLSDRRVYYWITGPAEFGYDKILDKLVDGAKIPVFRRSTGAAHWDDNGALYAAADVIMFPSDEEGFGNPTIESALHRRPVVVGDYPVRPELESHGFDWIHLDQPDRLHDVLRQPDPAMLDKNYQIAVEHFGEHLLPPRLHKLFSDAGWGDLFVAAEI